MTVSWYLTLNKGLHIVNKIEKNILDGAVFNGSSGMVFGRFGWVRISSFMFGYQSNHEKFRSSHPTYYFVSFLPSLSRYQTPIMFFLKQNCKRMTEIVDKVTPRILNNYHKLVFSCSILILRISAQGNFYGAGSHMSWIFYTRSFIKTYMKY